VVGYLIDGLIRGGISMVVAGNSSPASGGEHMISHYLDMESHALAREPFAYHGLQVGVGVMVVAAIYERLRKMDKGEVVRRLNERASGEYEERSRKYFPHSFEIVWQDFKKKLPLLARLPEILPASWEEIVGDVLPRLPAAETIRGYLSAAGCPDKFSGIGVDADTARRAVLGGRFIRGRLVSLDIADELGILTEVVEEVVN
jgi:glycerol-1-phosphate dehydrogenase [NAD(P)+]